MLDKRLLLVDDDIQFCQVLAKALAKRDFDVSVAHSVDEALDVMTDDYIPDYAVVDLSMPGGSSGLVLVEKLHAKQPSMRIVVLTGYASITTAIEAIKLGAIHYLAKPANADEIVAAFGKEAGDNAAAVADRPISVKRLEWEHIQKVLAEHDGNISAAARELGMHRRTLQRKLLKRPVKS